MERYATIVVVGGGCYGSYYVRQLRRAARAGALEAARVVVVDRDPRCAVSAVLVTSDGMPVELVTEEWTPFFADYFAAAGRADTPSRDAIVPSPLMPHLMFEWLLHRSRDRWPHRVVDARALPPVPAMPWQREGGDGVRYVSFAEWMCPVNCIEPTLCPATKGVRSWSMPPAIVAYVEEERRRGHALGGPVVLHCRHRTYGVGMIDTSAVLEGDRVVAEAGANGPAEVLVGTVSHCHGALAVLGIGA
ncbi:MAG TPA: hypothetical protein VEI06_15540 [Gemmatimonadaceae bacterium]|nr:hypothetical protein [Gemmatimonadaceae bacterium]